MIQKGDHNGLEMYLAVSVTRTCVHTMQTQIGTHQTTRNAVKRFSRRCRTSTWGHDATSAELTVLEKLSSVSICIDERVENHSD